MCRPHTTAGTHGQHPFSDSEDDPSSSTSQGMWGIC